MVIGTLRHSGGLAAASLAEAVDADSASEVDPPSTNQPAEPTHLRSCGECMGRLMNGDEYKMILEQEDLMQNHTIEAHRISGSTLLNSGLHRLGEKPGT